MRDGLVLRLSGMGHEDLEGARGDAYIRLVVETEPATFVATRPRAWLTSERKTGVGLFGAGFVFLAADLLWIYLIPPLGSPLAPERGLSVSTAPMWGAGSWKSLDARGALGRKWAILLGAYRFISLSKDLYGESYPLLAGKELLR
jgi:hypothetical protein